MEKRYEEIYTSPTRKHPQSQMIWDAVSVSGTSALYFLPSKTTMNGTCYINLLKLRLHMKIHLCSILVHDVDLCQKSKAVRSIFKRSKFRRLTGQTTAQIWTQKRIYREIWKIKWQKNSCQVLWNLLKS